MSSNLLVQMSRKALTYNYKAQREVLRELRDCGHIVPKLNVSQAVFNNFFLTTLNSHNEYEQARLGVETCTLESQHTTALWSSTNNDEPLDSGTEYELSSITEACLDYDLLTFVDNVLIKLGYTLKDIYNTTGQFKDFDSQNTSDSQDAKHVAHDFWLTRNGHGAGFWDGDYCQDGLGDALTILAKEFGECNLYVGKDNLIYIY